MLEALDTKVKRRDPTLICFLVMVILSTSCHLNQTWPPPRTPASGKSLVTVRSVLPRNSLETPKYGLYSYVLFGSRPTDLTRGRYLAVLSAFLEKFGEAKEYIGVLPLDRLNITYIPARTNPVATQISAAWLVDHYDYARARGFLDKVIRTHERDIYLVSSLIPLTRATTPMVPFLEQDLSEVPIQLLPLWIREFELRVSDERPWAVQELSNFALTLRTSLRMLADEQSLAIPGFQKAVQLVEKLAPAKPQQ